MSSSETIHGIICEFEGANDEAYTLQVPSPYVAIGPFRTDQDVFDCQFRKQGEVKLELLKGEFAHFAEQLYGFPADKNSDVIKSYTYEEFKQVGGGIFIDLPHVENSEIDKSFNDLLDHLEEGQVLQAWTICGYGK